MDEEIFNALRKIKDICKKSSNCANCPFNYEGSSCALTKNSPEYWDLVDNFAPIRYFEVESK